MKKNILMDNSSILLTKKIISIIQFSCLLIFTSCSTDEPDKISSNTCYEGVVVRDKTKACDFIVQIKNGKLGEDWDELKNCIHIKNLPEENQKLGSIIFFQNYKPADSPFCFASVLGLPASITIENYSSAKCL